VEAASNWAFWYRIAESGNNPLGKEFSKWIAKANWTKLRDLYFRWYVLVELVTTHI
jgi:hypothetical protein